MGAVDAFTMKQATYEGMHTGAWARWADGFTASLRGEAPGTLGASGFTQQADAFSRDLVTTLSLAETFYVSPDMNTLVTAAAEGWEADETVEAEDFLVDHGWVYIPGGIANIDVRGRLYTTSALTWARRGAEVRVTFWADKHNDSPQEREHPAWQVLPQMTPWHLTTVHLGQPLPSALRFGRTLPPEVSDQIVWMETEHGYAMSFPQGWSAEEMQPRTGPDPTVAWLVSTLRIMQQPLASVKGAGLPAGVRKGWKANPVRVKNTKITVIDFRRRVGEFESGTGREFTHRFLRRGHWRKQWMGSEKDGTRRQARIWINPTVVGPADKPLVLREHVNALTR